MLNAENKFDWNTFQHINVDWLLHGFKFQDKTMKSIHFLDSVDSFCSEWH